MAGSKKGSHIAQHLRAPALIGKHLHQGLWEGALGRVVPLPVHGSLLHRSALLMLVPMIVAMVMVMVLMLVMMPMLGLTQCVPAHMQLLATMQMDTLAY